MPVIIVEKGPEKGRTVEIKSGGRIVFGRDASCDFVMADTSCSRRHFGIAEKDGRFILKDLGSTHGTTLNGNTVGTKELADGDAIVAGETVLTFAIDKTVGRGLIGKTIAGYQIEERLGRGGMGTVYRAKQVALDRDVALKVLSAKFSKDKTFINRFFKEAQAAARLNNPNVVQVYDVREEKGLYIISLEMMNDGTIQDLATTDGQLEIAHVLEIAKDAAKGLVYAEKKSIVHGDIKPDNLMRNSDGHVKISDLGLARDAGDIAHQGEEGIFGTPHFISPEQAQGKAVDSRSDIYSLGATLYRLIAGKTPFVGSSVREIILAQINEEPPNLKELRPDCPQDLIDLIAVMMAKNPDERFESAETLLNGIESLGSTGNLETVSSGRTKIAMFALVVVLGGSAAAFFGLKDDKPPANNDDNKTVVVNTGKSASDLERDRQIKLQERKLEVKGLLLKANSFEVHLGQQGKGKSRDVPSLEQLKQKFQAVVQAGPEVSEAGEARRRITEIDNEIAEIKIAAKKSAAQAAAERATADKIFATLEATLTTKIKNREFVAAFGLMSAGKENLAGTAHEANLPALETKVRNALKTASKTLKQDVQKKLEVADFIGAKKLLNDFLTAIVGSASDDTPPEIVKAEVKAAKAQLNTVAATELTKKEADRKLDQSTLLKSLQSFYIACEKKYDLEKSKRSIAAMKAALQTNHFDDRVQQVEYSLARALALRQAVIDAITSASREVLTLSGSREIPSGKIIKADNKKFVVQKRSKKTENISWIDLEPATLYRQLFRKFCDNTRDRIDLCTWLVDCGLLEEAAEIAKKLKATDYSAHESEVRDLFLRLEIETAAAHALTEIRDLYTKAKNGKGNSAWFRIESRLRAFVSDFRDTRSFLLHSDGRTPLD